MNHPDDGKTPAASAEPGAEAGTGGSFPQSGEILDGKYRLGRLIGQGAMAVVLEAAHLNLDDRVAIKILLPHLAEDPVLVERFLREGRTATRIRSEHGVRVFDVGSVGRRPYIVMEYLDGSDLEQLVAQRGPLAPDVAVDYVLQACEAIAEAHVAGVIHRDLKPANLFLTRRADGSACVKVLDFGISKVTSGPGSDAVGTLPQTMMGSPHYMAPEQMLSSRDVDVRADLWALGAILHELISGAPPFTGETVAELSAAVLRDPAPRLSTVRAGVSPALEAVVSRCLEKDPARRFPSVADLAEALAPLGSATAPVSAARVVGVIGGESSATGPVRRLGPEVEEAPSSGRGRMVGYVAAGLLFVGAAVGIAQIARRDRAAALEAAQDAGVTSTGAASVSTVAEPPPPARASAAREIPPPPAAPAPPAETEAPKPAKEPPGRAARPPGRPPRPPWKRAPKGSPPRDAPLPDFPIPTATDQAPSTPVVPPAAGPSNPPPALPPPGH